MEISFFSSLLIGHRPGTNGVGTGFTTSGDESNGSEVSHTPDPPRGYRSAAGLMSEYERVRKMFVNHFFHSHRSLFITATFKILK